MWFIYFSEVSALKVATVIYISYSSARALGRNGVCGALVPGRPFRGGNLIFAYAAQFRRARNPQFLTIFLHGELPGASVDKIRYININYYIMYK